MYYNYLKFFLLSTKIPDSNKEAEIEDLYPQDYQEKHGMNTPDRDDNKIKFAENTFNHYKDINFDLFKPLFDNLVEIIKQSQVDN